MKVSFRDISIPENEYYPLFCRCGCKEGLILKYDKIYGDASISFVTDYFYTGRNSHLYSLKEKLKRIWCIIRNKEYEYFEIIIDKNELENFKHFVERM